MTKKIVHTEVHTNPTSTHPLNFLANNYEAIAVAEDGTSAYGYGDSKAGAVANAVSKVQHK